MLPGHADGHIVLERDGVVLAGDTILTGITPAIGLYPNSRPDPLGDYLESLRWYEERAPRVAYTGHREPVTDPAGRAAEIAEHHAHRLDRAEAALDGTPLSAYDVSLALFEDDLSIDAPPLRDGRGAGPSRTACPRGTSGPRRAWPTRGPAIPWTP